MRITLPELYDSAAIRLNGQRSVRRLLVRVSVHHRDDLLTTDARLTVQQLAKHFLKRMARTQCTVSNISS